MTDCSMIVNRYNEYVQAVQAASDVQHIGAAAIH